MQGTAGTEQYVAAEAVKFLLGRTELSPPSAVKIPKQAT